MHRVALSIFDQGNNDLFQWRQIWFVLSHHFIQQFSEVDSVGTAQTLVVEILDDEIIQCIIASVFSRMPLGRNLGKIFGQLLSHLCPRIFLRHITLAASRQTLNATQRRIAGSVTQSVRMRISARSFLEAHPILERLFRRCRHNGRHDHTHEQLNTQRMQETYEVRIVIAPLDAQASAFCIIATK